MRGKTEQLFLISLALLMGGCSFPQHIEIFEHPAQESDHESYLQGFQDAYFMRPYDPPFTLRMNGHNMGKVREVYYIWGYKHGLFAHFSDKGRGR